MYTDHWSLAAASAVALVRHRQRSTACITVDSPLRTPNLSFRKHHHSSPNPGRGELPSTKQLDLPKDLEEEQAQQSGHIRRIANRFSSCLPFGSNSPTLERSLPNPGDKAALRCHQDSSSARLTNNNIKATEIPMYIIDESCQFCNETASESAQLGDSTTAATPRQRHRRAHTASPHVSKLRHSRGAAARHGLPYSQSTAHPIHFSLTDGNAAGSAEVSPCARQHAANDDAGAADQIATLSHEAQEAASRCRTTTQDGAEEVSHRELAARTVSAGELPSHDSSAGGVASGNSSARKSPQDTSARTSAVDSTAALQLKTVDMPTLEYVTGETHNSAYIIADMPTQDYAILDSPMQSCVNGGTLMLECITAGLPTLEYATKGTTPGQHTAEIPTQEYLLEDTSIRGHMMEDSPTLEEATIDTPTQEYVREDTSIQDHVTDGPPALEHMAEDIPAQECMTEDALTLQLDVYMDSDLESETEETAVIDHSTDSMISITSSTLGFAEADRLSPAGTARRAPLQPKDVFSGRVALQDISCRTKYDPKAFSAVAAQSFAENDVENLRPISVFPEQKVTVRKLVELHSAAAEAANRVSSFDLTSFNRRPCKKDPAGRRERRQPTCQLLLMR